MSAAHLLLGRGEHRMLGRAQVEDIHSKLPLRGAIDLLADALQRAQEVVRLHCAKKAYQIWMRKLTPTGGGQCEAPPVTLSAGRGIVLTAMISRGATWSCRNDEHSIRLCGKESGGEMGTDLRRLSAYR